ncbi:MAG TPA: ABC transporter permease [Candidatus Sulfotelmatobacter sp.]|jgi:predicted permease
MKLRQLFGRRKEDSELLHELDSHLQHEIDDNIAQGMSANEARRQAYVKVGNPLVIRDRVFETNRIAWLEDLWRDLRYAARTLRKSPSFTLVALLVMALGIGANAAIYSFLDSLLLSSLPVSDPASLVVINWHGKGCCDGDSVMHSMSGGVYDDERGGSISPILPFGALSVLQDSSIFSDVFSYAHTRAVRAMNVSVNGQAEVVSGELVSGNYFRGLGISPAAGRLIFSEDDQVGAAPVIVASYAFAERHFGGATSALGQTLTLNGVPFTVAGVAPPEFFGVDPSQAPGMYVPMHNNLLLGANDPYPFTAKDYLDNNYYWVQAMARLRPGVTLAQAQAQLAPKFHQWVQATAANDKERAALPELVLREGRGGIDSLRREYSKPLFLLMTLVALILVIACSNVANLLLARASSRRREIAVRLSEGASRARVIRQLLTESVLLGAMGGALGVLLAFWGIRLLSALLAAHSDEGAMLHAHLNWHVLAVAAGLAVLTGLIFGLIPALQSTRMDLVSALKETRTSQSHSKPSGWRVSMSQVLVVGQIATTMLMLVAAGLFVRTLKNLESVNLGFNRNNVLLFTIDATKAGYKDPQISELYGRILDQLAAMPGVRSAGIARGSLIDGEDSMPISTVGGAPSPETRYMQIGPNFLTTMQIPILEGRDIGERDRPGSQPVAVISEEFARLNFPRQNPLGQHVMIWHDGEKKKLARDMEIVGVAKNARYGGLKRETLPVVYITYNQGFPPPDEMMYALRTAGDPLGFVDSIRNVVRRADAHLPVSEVRTQAGDVESKMHNEKILAELCTALALLALTIACVGLYGTISYTVARRTGEIGIRMALGAHRGPIVWMVLRQVIVMAAVGLAISVPIALGTSKFVASLLFDMKPNDPTAIVLAVLVLIAAALLAGGIPARRASKIDPMTALRHE